MHRTFRGQTSEVAVVQPGVAPEEPPARHVDAAERRVQPGVEDAAHNAPIREHLPTVQWK